jgi:hypothetical protein
LNKPLGDDWVDAEKAKHREILDKDETKFLMGWADLKSVGARFGKRSREYQEGYRELVAEFFGGGSFVDFQNLVEEMARLDKTPGGKRPAGKGKA